MQKYDVELIVWVQVKDQSTSESAFLQRENLKRISVGILVISFFAIRFLLACNPIPLPFLFSVLCKCVS